MQTNYRFKRPFSLLFSQKSRTSFGTACKCCAVGVLFLFSVLLVACGGSTASSNLSLGAPPVTITINLNGNNNMSPTPTLPPYWCGAWATNTSPLLNSTVGVYAKFVQNVNGNPQGIEGATATATVTWPDGATTSQTVTTTKDGLAVFYISTAGQTDALGHITFVTVSFQANGTPGCQVDSTRAAYFTVIVVSPTPTKATPTKGTHAQTPGH
jgi:hypothetical protein